MRLNLDGQYALGYLEGFTKELAKRIAKLEAAKSNTHDGRCIVPEERVLRWERIEKAARHAVWETELASHDGMSLSGTLWELREALKP